MTILNRVVTRIEIDSLMRVNPLVVTITKLGEPQGFSATQQQ